MLLSYVFCAAGVICYSGLYLLLGGSQKQKADASGVNLVIYCAGGILSVASALPLRAAEFPRGVIFTGSFIGITAVVGLLGTILAMRAGIAVSAVNTILSLAMIVPIVLSMALYYEMPHARTYAGIVLAGVSVYLIEGRKS
ncbi:MAG: hypothetical protein KGM47_17520 [Acidobacteriota bacterium]|nr:hypothetical protein [Acidobacteriota bacterium]